MRRCLCGSWMALVQGGVGTPDHQVESSGMEAEKGHCLGARRPLGLGGRGQFSRARVWILAGVAPDRLCDLAITLASAGLISLICKMGAHSSGDLAVYTLMRRGTWPRDCGGVSLL